MKTPRVCFVCPYSYPLFNPDYHNMFGGWEVRISLLAKEIAKRGNFQVCLIVADAGQPHRETRDGVELFSWQGKAFYGIQKSSLSQEAEEGNWLPPYRRAESAKQAPAPKRLNVKAGRVSIRGYYKKIVPWRIRLLAHGLFDSLVFGVRAAGQHAASVIRISRQAIGHISDLPVYPEMVQIFKEVDADIYVVPGNNHISASVAWYCRQNRKAYIMLAGSDQDFSPEILDNPNGVNTYGDSNLYRSFSIRNARLHIVQTQHQIELASRFGVSPILVPSPIDLERKFPREENPDLILWVGNSNERVKQPSVILELIRQLPDYRFTMIVTPVEQENYLRITEAAKGLSNLTLVSRIPFEEVERFYASARVLVNTSSFEGFPNAFLQAGKYGVPIVSLNVDPNGIFTGFACGLLCEGQEAKLKEAIERLMGDSALYARLSSNILDYVRKNHDKEKIIPEYERIFCSILRK